MAHYETSKLGIYIEDLHESIRGAVRTYWTEHLKSDINKLASHATTVTLVMDKRNSQTADGQALIVETDRERPRHTSTYLEHNNSAHAQTEHQPANRGIEYDDDVLSSELFVVNAQYADDEN